MPGAFTFRTILAVDPRPALALAARRVTTTAHTPVLVTLARPATASCLLRVPVITKLAFLALGPRVALLTDTPELPAMMLRAFLGEVLLGGRTRAWLTFPNHRITIIAW